MKFHTPPEDDRKPAWSVPRSLEVRQLLASNSSGGRLRFCEQALPSLETPLAATRSARIQVTPEEPDEGSEEEEMADETCDEETVLKGGHDVLLVDYDRAGVDRRNIILPFDALIRFLDENFVCKYCGKSDSKVHRSTVGVATSLNWYCACRHVASVKAKLRSTMEGYDGYVAEDKAKKLAAKHYDLNVRFLAGVQQFGGGETEAHGLAGMMDLAVNPISNSWVRLEEEINLSQIHLGKAVLDENLAAEVEATKAQEDCVTFEGKVGISVQGDSRWDQRKSGRAYNSDSGSHLLVGNATMKCVAVEVMSKRCSKCEKGIVHLPCFCPKNYDGSSKGMEATGAIRNVIRLNNQSVFLKTYVMDDDSSTKAILRHSWQELIDAGKMTKDDWPRTPAGRKKKDNGQLPLSHPKIEFLADKNHRVRTYAKYFFDLSQKRKSESTCTYNDAERMKRNFSYFIHMYHTQPFPLFMKASKAVLQHHFNNHEFCDDWCPWKKWSDEQRILKELKYRSLDDDKELYLQFEKIHVAFTTEEALRDLYHEVHSNKCESINGFITKFLPKKKHFCRTIANPGRTYLALGIDSLGYQEYYRRLFIELGLDMTPVTRTQHVRIDSKRDYHSAYVQRPEVKRRRFQDRVDKVSTQNEKLLQDKQKGLIYESGMAGPVVPNGNGNEEAAAEEAPAKRKSYYHAICPACKKKGHTTVRSINCLLSSNPKSKWYKDATDVATFPTADLAGKFLLHVPVCYDMLCLFLGARLTSLILRTEMSVASTAIGTLDVEQEDVEREEDALDNLNITTAEMENSQLKALYELTRLDSRGFEEDEQIGDGH
jgi:hypothetical protein